MSMNDIKYLELYAKTALELLNDQMAGLLSVRTEAKAAMINNKEKDARIEELESENKKLNSRIQILEEEKVSYHSNNEQIEATSKDLTIDVKMRESLLLNALQEIDDLKESIKKMEGQKPKRGPRIKKELLVEQDKKD